jgi:hypothetical protein
MTVVRILLYRVIFNAGNSPYLKVNETFTLLKKYTDTSGLVNVSQAWHFYVVKLEKALQTVIKDRVHVINVAKEIFTELAKLTVPTRCVGFLKAKLLMFYIRLRLYYIMKYENRVNVNQKKKKKIYKQFAHA